MTDPLTAFCFVVHMKIGTSTWEEVRDCFKGAHAEIICKKAQSDTLTQFEKLGILQSITACKESRGV